MTSEGESWRSVPVLRGTEEGSTTMPIISVRMRIGRIEGGITVYCALWVRGGEGKRIVTEGSRNEATRVVSVSVDVPP